MGTATYVKTDAATKGNWAGVYGADGYQIVQVDTLTPAYATVTPSGNSSFNWGGVSGMSPYEASSPTTPDPWIWYGTTIDIDVAISDGNEHQLAFYYFQNDGNSRTLTVEVLDMDAGAAVLDTRTIGGGAALQTAPVYLVWNCTGHVKVRTTVSGLNAILSAYFFDPVPRLNPAAAALTITGYAPSIAQTILPAGPVAGRNFVR